MYRVRLYKFILLVKKKSLNLILIAMERKWMYVYYQ